jgi:hypothetical protein
MGKSLDNVMKEVNKLYGSIKAILTYIDYADYEDLSKVDIDLSNADELFIADELRHIMDELENVSCEIAYLNRPVKAVGTLVINNNGRYELDGHEFTCGSGIECLINDGRHFQYDEHTHSYIDTPYWTSGRMEHNGENYYILGINKSPDSLKVRYR